MDRNILESESEKLASEFADKVLSMYENDQDRYRIVRRTIGKFMDKLGYRTDPKHKDNPDTTEKQAHELWEGLVQYCIDFLNKNNNSEIDAVYFSVDGIQGSRPYNKWCPCTDSSFTLEEQKSKREIIFEGL